MQRVSNGPVDGSIQISEHEEQMDEMQFLLDKRSKEVERVSAVCRDHRPTGVGGGRALQLGQYFHCSTRKQC